MKIHNLGYPRIGVNLEYIKAFRKYWSGLITQQELLAVAKEVRLQNWKIQQSAGVHLIPCNDFSYYDAVLDTCLLFGAIPERFQHIEFDTQFPDIDRGFAMAKGWFEKGEFIEPMKTCQWLNSSYHFVVPEFYTNQYFSLRPWKIIQEIKEAREAGIKPKPVLLGPVSFLLLGEEVEAGFQRLELIGNLLPKYIDLFHQLEHIGIRTIQLDEPCFAYELTEAEQKILHYVYKEFSKRFPRLEIMLTTNFSIAKENIDTLLKLPVTIIHLDLINNPAILPHFMGKDFQKTSKILSLGIIDGANIWKNNYNESLSLIDKVIEKIGINRVWIGPSCSLMHVPYDIDSEIESDYSQIKNGMKQWFSFAKQKLLELQTLYLIITSNDILYTTIQLIDNNENLENRMDAVNSGKIIGYDNNVVSQMEEELSRNKNFRVPLSIENALSAQDLDVHYQDLFTGFIQTARAWIQINGTEVYLPSIVYGDIALKEIPEQKWSTITEAVLKKVEIELMGPLSILATCFIRNDQPIYLTGSQIAISIREFLTSIHLKTTHAVRMIEPNIWQLLPLNSTEFDVAFKYITTTLLLSRPEGSSQAKFNVVVPHPGLAFLQKLCSEFPLEIVSTEVYDIATACTHPQKYYG